MRTKIRTILFFISTIVILRSVFSQFEPNPALHWYTIETKHFYVHYHNGAERTANSVADICEEIYGPITSLYNYEPNDKVSFIVNDESDLSNGATDYYGNRIEIEAASLDFDLRGTHNWLRNVITHEFTHICQVQSSMKFSRKVPSIYLQILDYENERRPDVLYVYPVIIVSYPISGIGVPSWYAEGTAQYQRQQMGYDNWDSHRDMILRMRTLGDNLLSWNDMGQFASVTTYKAESIYNQGFALVRYISEKYGEDKLKELSRCMGDILTFSTEGSFEKALGKKGFVLYDEWKNFLIKDYKTKTDKIKKVRIEGDKIDTVGYANFYPRFSPDGRKISYLSNKTSDYLGTPLFIHKLDGKEEDDELIIPPFGGGYDWSKDGKFIIFSRRSKPTIHEQSIFDLHIYDLKDKSENQLTFGKRAHSPAISTDCKNVCYIINGDGSQNLWMAKLTATGHLIEQTKLTDFNNGEQLFNPCWSPDGKYIFFDFAKTNERNICKLDITNNKFDIILGKDKTDFRTPQFSNDGKYMFISSDKTGIFNIYRYNMENDSIPMDDRINSLQQVTNVLGGAFMPSVDTNGNLTFSSFQSTGYKINYLKNYTILDSLIADKDANYLSPERVLSKYANEDASNSSLKKNKFDWEHLRKYDDDNPKIHNKISYNNISTPLFFIPTIRFDNYTKKAKFLEVIKPGLYFYSQDVIGRMGIFGGASINSKLERDLFLQFDYNNGVPFLKDFFVKSLGFVPHFTLSGYNVTRKTNASILVGLDSIPVDITYDLLEFDFDMAFKIINSSHNVHAGFSVSKYTSSFNTFIIPGSGGQQVPATSTNYFNGRDLSLNYIYSNFLPSKNDDINPVGRYVNLKYDYEFNYLNPSFQVDQQGNLVEVFTGAKFHRLEGDWLESFGIFNSHSIGFRLRGGTIFGPRQDNFFDFYASGFPGMKGYPFYAIGGNRYFSANLTYRFPIVENLDYRFLQLYFDKIYFSIYGDAGNAWYENQPKLKDFKKDIGAELRIQAWSYFVYPTSFAFNAAYGLDEFQRIFPSTTNQNQLIKYGKEWRFYFTVLFGFDFLVDDFKKIKNNF
jgi:Tol biopolymer transport system component